MNTSSHIGHAELSPDKNNYTFTCAFSQCDVSFTAPKDQFIGSYVASDTNLNLGNSQTPLAYGIDVSSHQEEISQEQWNEIANTQIEGHTITFAILRIGREVSNNTNGSINRKIDEQFENNYERAKAAGLQVGCYFDSSTMREDESSMIIRAGMNVYPVEIENSLSADSRVKDVLVYGYKKGDTQEIGMKICGEFANREEVLELCRKELPSFQIPSKIELVDETEVFSGGKKRRKIS